MRKIDLFHHFLVYFIWIILIYIVYLYQKQER